MPLPIGAPAVSPLTRFQPAFFKPCAPAPEAPARAPAEAGRPRISYATDRHGPHAEFSRSADFEQYRQEVADDLRFLTQLAQDLGMDDVEDVRESLRILYDHRFHEDHFSTHAELFDGVGKRSLDNVCDMLRDGRLPDDTRRNAIRDLARGVTLCASGAVVNLMTMDRDLSLSSGGMHSKLWKMKEDVVRSVLQQAVSEQYGAEPYYLGDEVHYVSGAWNHIADAVGLNKVSDLMVPRMPQDFLNVCQEKVLAAISPDKLARRMAQDCLDEFRSRTIGDPDAASGVCTPAAAARFGEVLDDIRRDLGLDESALGMHAFVRLDDDGGRYHVRTDCALIAVALLRAMNADSLLADAPRQLGERVDADGARIGLYHYGDRLAWRLRQEMEGAAPWFAQRDVEVIDGQELTAWSDAQGPDAPTPPPGVMRAILRGQDPAELMSVRANWLGTSRSILSLLKRLDAEQVIQYLGANMPYLRAEFPESERADFLHEAITMGEPGRELARAWYPDPWALLGDTPGQYGPLTQLERWIMASEAGPIDTVREMIAAGWSGGHEAASLGDAIFKGLTGVDGRSLMRVLAHSASAAGIDAVHRLIVGLLNEPALREAIADRLPALFCGSRGHIGALYVMDNGDAATLAALHRMFFNPGILPLIKDDMRGILLGGDPDGEFPMWSALCSQDASLIQAYGALLADVAAVPGMEKWLAILASPNKSFGSGERAQRFTENALLHVSVDAANVIKAYHAILVHPAILPNIRHMLPQLLGFDAEGDSRRPGYLTGVLLIKKMDGWHRAYRQMVTDPRILPHTLRDLPEHQFARLVRAGIVELPMAPAVHSMPGLPASLARLG